ncbi:MAG: hypothetical protein ACRC2A_00740 [Enterobacterales bacterium]
MLSNATVGNVKKLNSAVRQLREHREDSELFSYPDEFAPSPTNALGIHAQAIPKMSNDQPFGALTNYLRGLSYVREQLIAAHGVLDVKGKKKYENYIKRAVETLPAQLKGLTSQHMDILTNLITAPFRRSVEKDRRELSDSLCLIADDIEKYRYHTTDERYREYAKTIINGIDTEQLPPMISCLVIHE